MSQLTFEGMPRRLYPAAPARLSTYADCPRRYRLAYLDRVGRGGPWGRTTVGSSVHVALARWWDLPLARRTAEAGGELVAEAWVDEGFRDAAQSRVARDQARGWVEAYLADADPAATPLGVELTVAVRTPRAHLWGRVDRVDRRGEEAVVVDYKTGRQAPTVDDARDSPALAVYAAAVAETLRLPCRRVELHHLPTGTVAGFEHSAPSLASAVAAADDVAAELDGLDEAYGAGLSRADADALFPAQVAPRCATCEVRSSCRPGQTVRAKPAWTGLD